MQAKSPASRATRRATCELFGLTVAARSTAAQSAGGLADLLNHVHQPRVQDARGADVVVRLHPEHGEISRPPEQSGEDDQTHSLGEDDSYGERDRAGYRE